MMAKSKAVIKMMAIAIVAVMTMMYAVPTAFAADDYTLTINNTESGHTYTAYQIFKGSKASNNSQVSYVALADDAVFSADATYYYKVGADYIAADDVTSTNFGTKKASLYTRTGDSALGDVVWGADITDAGKAALYTAYGMTVANADLNKTANILALIDKIAEGDANTKSESDKAVKFANVFYTTGADGSVTAKGAYLTGPTGGKAINSTGGTITFDNLASGYYLVNDSYTPASGEELGIDYSIARTAVQVVGNTVINNKADKIKSEKKIKTSQELTQEKANELGIGRVVEYEVTEVVPNYDGYKWYYFDMRDKMSDGLTFNKDSVKVTVGGTLITKLASASATSDDGKGYYLYADKTADAEMLNGDTFVIAFENIMNFTPGDAIVVTYTANVNSNAITGVNPNKNEVKVDYSNDPTKSEKGDKTGYPGVPANTENHPVGSTPKTYTDTYTTKLTINKKDGNSQALAGVEFTLTGTSQDVVVQNDTVYELDPNGTFYMLKDGTYTETPPQNKATLQETTGNSGWVKDSTYTGTDARVVDGEILRPFVVETDQGTTHYVIVEGNAAAYASTTLLYSPTTKSTAANVTDAYKVAMTGKTGADGKLDFSQLGAGTYKLSETEVLPGYNDIKDIEFRIDCALPADNTVVAGTETATWTITPITEGVTFTPGTGDNLGTFSIDIENNKGTELPSTGGIGTTLFYLIGGILIIGAGVILVTRRRVSTEE